MGLRIDGCKLLFEVCPQGGFARLRRSHGKDDKFVKLTEAGDAAAEPIVFAR